MISKVSLDEVSVFGHGVTRPETVLVLGERVFVSDGSDAAISEVLPDGSIRKMGYCPGETNGLSALNSHTAVFTVFDKNHVSTIDLETEEVKMLADSVEGRPLTFPNFPLAAPDGTVWVSCTTQQVNPLVTIAHRLADGYIVRIGTDGSTKVVAQDIAFANCMAFGAEAGSIFVVRTTLSDIAQFETDADGGLTFVQRYGPPLGGRRDDEIGDEFMEAPFNPELFARWALADGCGFDAEGNLWVTLMSANRIVAITPSGEVVTVLDDPDGKIMQAPASLAWGGPDLKDLYIGSIASPYILKTRSPTAGLALWHNNVEEAKGAAE